MSSTRIVVSLASGEVSDAVVQALPGEVSWLRVCAAAGDDPDPAALRRAFGGSRAYALDPIAAAPSVAAADALAEPSVEGRRGRLRKAAVGLSVPRRHARLRAATSGYDLVELDADQDLDAETLAAIPPEKRLISWRGVAADAAELRRRFDEIAAIPARYYRLVVHADRAREALAPLELLRELGRDDVIAFASGRAGTWSRLLSPLLGSPFVYGRAMRGQRPDDFLAADRLATDYGFPDPGRIERLFGIVGDPVLHSLSPRLHNAAYRALGAPYFYVPFHAASFAELWEDLVGGEALRSLGLELGGLTVASPHKEAVLLLADEISPTSRRAGAANVFVPNGGGGWRATTTDASGTLELLRDHGVEPRGGTAAVFGCGGSGRAIALALEDAGWDVVLVNRGAARAALARTLLHLPFVPQTEFRANGHALVVNATPVGTGASAGSLPFDVGGLRPGAIVVDLPYGRRTTPLVSAARARGLLAIDGRQMLLAQVPQQFELMTGTAMPAGLAERALGAAAAPPAAEPMTTARLPVRS